MALCVPAPCRHPAVREQVVIAPHARVCVRVCVPARRRCAAEHAPGARAAVCGRGEGHGEGKQRLCEWGRLAG